MAKRTVITLILLAVSLAAFAEEKQSLPRIDGARILMIIARRDFRDEELFQPRQIFLKQGAQVRVASSSMKEAQGMLIADAKPDKFDAIIFVGGVGAKYTGTPVQIDGRDTTANGPKAAGAFAVAVVKALAESKKPKGSNNEDRKHQQERSD